VPLGDLRRRRSAVGSLAHGILPSALAKGGLRAAIDGLVARVDLAVTVEVTAERLPAALEATAYFIVAEALTNTLKHSDAGEAEIVAAKDGGVLRLAVRDDGVGGASTDGHSGLLGLHDRAAAVDGELRVVSPPGGGTLVAATLPIPAAQGPRLVTLARPDPLQLAGGSRVPVAWTAYGRCPR